MNLVLCPGLILLRIVSQKGVPDTATGRCFQPLMSVPGQTNPSGAPFDHVMLSELVAKTY